MSARNPALSNTIAKAVFDADPHLLLFGLSGSESVKAATVMGLRTVSEVFADRTYQDDGSLTPRAQPNALIADTKACIQQVLQMIQQQAVTSISGKQVHIIAETICLHGDGEHAVAFAKNIYQTLEQQSIGIKAI
jgi:UPF0271 protein